MFSNATLVATHFLTLKNYFMKIDETVVTIKKFI